MLIDNVLEIALIHKCLSISTQLRKMGLVEKQERNSRDRKMVNKVIKSSVWWLIFTWIWVLVFGLAQVTWFSDANSQKQMKFVLWSVGSVFATLQVRKIRNLQLVFLVYIRLDQHETDKEAHGNV